MQTLQPTLRLGRDVWDRTAMPPAEFLDRVSRLRASMARAGLDTMLLYGSGLNGCGHPTYVSNYIVKLPFSALVVLPREGDPALIFEGATRGRSAAAATTWIEDVRPCWKMADVCLEVLKERGLTAATIGLAAMPRLVPHAEWATLAAGLQRARLVDVEDLIDGQRAVKSTRERDQVRRASEMVNRALESLPASDESSIAAHAMRAARMQGAEDIRLMIARPLAEGWTFRPPEDAAVREGDTLAVTLCASWERYWAEATRTFVARDGRLDVVWGDGADARFRAIVAGVRAGATIADWVNTTLSAMTPAERRALEPHGVGHGIGVTPEEGPALAAANRDVFAPGMCVVVRAALVTAGGVALRAETVVV